MNIVKPFLIFLAVLFAIFIFLGIMYATFIFWWILKLAIYAAIVTSLIVLYAKYIKK